MKNLITLALGCLLFGCGHNEFDVSAEQVSKHLSSAHSSPAGGMPDFAHLPPGAAKHEFAYKKGDRLPDGTIATRDGKMVTFQLSKTVPNTGGAPKQFVFQTTEK